jgi:heme exporter protein B
MIGAAKIVGHWLTFGPLLLIAAVPGSFLVGLDGAALSRSVITLAIGTPALAALAVAVASLTAGLPRSGALAGLLLMPLAVPLVIFGAAATGDGESAALKLEAAVSLLLVAGASFVSGAAIRASRT